MSDKFFFKGRPGNKPKHVNHAFAPKRVIKQGTPEHPLSLSVENDARKAEIEGLVEDNGLHAVITVDVNVPENLAELDCILNKPVSVSVEQTPNRNDPCSCGSGKKFKKCCG